MIGQNLSCVMYWADFENWSWPARCNRLNGQKLSSLKLTPYLWSFYKSAVFGFRSIQNALQFKVYPSAAPAGECLYLHGMNSWTQNCPNSQILRFLKVSGLKHEVQARYVIIMVNMINNIPRFHFVFSCNVFKDFWGEKKSVQRFLVLNVV